jgi:hypothetical protein
MSSIVAEAMRSGQGENLPFDGKQSAGASAILPASGEQVDD